MYPYYNPRYYPTSSSPYYRTSSKDDGRGGLLLPLLFGAAVGFPIGYIASNTNKNQGYGYAPQPYMMPYPMYPQYNMAPPMPMYY